MSQRLLIVDDDASLGETLALALTTRGWSATSTTSGAEALDRLASADFDVVVTDLTMPGMTGLELCEQVVANQPDLPVIVLTAFGSLETAIAAIRVGAYDFLTKPVEIEALVVAVDRARQHRVLRDEVRRLRRLVDEAAGFDELVGESVAMRKLYGLLERIVDSDASVLITGESGTGKEVVARALHRRGPRRQGPFVAVNCAAMPEALLESELFGHVRGAFTDARAPRTGLMVEANRGTLFLDEIGDLPLPLQPKLLRALQERTVRPLGSNREVPFDVHLITATNRDLETAIEEERFREDLYFRINVIQVAVPPLRARASDVLLLAQHFLTQHAARSGRPVRTISPPAAERLSAYAWPGNVRELQNSIERAVALARFDSIMVDDLPDPVRAYRPSHVVVVGENPAELPPLEEVERRYILKVLEVTGGNKALAARVLGLGRKTLYRKLERWGMHGDGDDDGPAS